MSGQYENQGQGTKQAELALSIAEHHAVEAHRDTLSQERGEEVSFDEALADWMDNCAVQWRQDHLANYLVHQRAEILRHKWIESEKANRDLGKEAIMDWIKNHAADWRAWYEDHYTAEHPDGR